MMIKHNLCQVLVFLLTETAYTRTVVPLAITSVGTFHGFIETFEQSDKNVEVFSCIRYARPPENLHRFRPPERPRRTPLVSRFKPVVVDSYPPACAQDSTYRGRNHEVSASEDCLYVTVWRRAGTAALSRKPVVVVIHDDGFQSGQAHAELRGTAMAALGDVVVVGFNYRLGIFGFLNLGVHGADKYVGLEDQHMALMWVHDHIHSFGGDRHNVVLMGSGAGASSLLYQLERMPKIFHAAIIGSLWTPPGDSNVNASGHHARNMSQAAGCAGTSPEEVAFCLRTQDVAMLAASIGRFFPELKVFSSVLNSTVPVLIGTVNPVGMGSSLSSKANLGPLCETLRLAYQMAKTSLVYAYHWNKSSAPSDALLAMVGQPLLGMNAILSTASSPEILPEVEMVQLASKFAATHAVDSFARIKWTPFYNNENVFIFDDLSTTQMRHPYADNCEILVPTT